MKWVNHQMIGFGTGYLLTGDLSSAIVASVASVLPDFLEKMGCLIRAKHGESTHNPFYWIIALIISMGIAWFFGRETLLDYLFVFFIGLMTHLFFDSLTLTGIPISRNGQVRIALRLFRTGHMIEYFIAMAFLAFCFKGYLILVLGKHFDSPAELINPLAYIQKEAYVHAWNHLYELFFRGFMARFFAAAFLLAALWFGFYRQNFIMAVVLFSLTVIICYLGSVVEAAFWFLK